MEKIQKFKLNISDAQTGTVAVCFNNSVFNLLLRMKTTAVIRQLFVSFQGLKSPNSSWNQPVLAAWLKSPSRQPIATKTTNYLSSPNKITLSSLCWSCTTNINTPSTPYAGGIWKRRTGFTLKTHRMFSAHTKPEKFENRTITGIFFFLFLFGKLGLEKCFPVTWKRKAVVFKFLRPVFK